MKIKLIANPIAGGDAVGKIESAALRMRSFGHEVDLCLTGARGDAQRFAQDARIEGYDRIVAAGGDGTLNEVINGLVPSSVPLAFLPLGTTNVFALEAGIPFDIDGACDVALNAEPRPVSLGVADETRFLLMAGIGPDAEAVYHVSGRLKRLTGKFAYVVSAFKVFFGSPPPPFNVILDDGSTFQAYGGVLGNCRLYGGRFTVTPDASLDEQPFDATFFLRSGRIPLLRCVLAVASGKRLAAPFVSRFRASALRMEGENVHVQIDGDYFGRLPLAFRSTFGEISLVMPSGTGPLR